MSSEVSVKEFRNFMVEKFAEQWSKNENVQRWRFELLEPIREIYTFIYGGKPTLVGRRGYEAAMLIEEVGAVSHYKNIYYYTVKLCYFSNVFL